MATNKDATVIIFDVGQNTTQRTLKDGPNFLELEKECVRKILMRKLFSKPKDEAALILMGTDGTDNDLNEELQGYEHISKAFAMGIVTWSMLKYIDYSIEPANSQADWLDAILVAMDCLKKTAPPKSTRKIVLMTTFTATVNPSDLDAVTSQLKVEKIELIVISSAIAYQVDDEHASEKAVFSQTTDKESARKRNEKLIQKLIDESNGVLCSFDGALQQMIYFEKMQRRRSPWNCDLEIGTSIKIKISAVIYVREESQIASWKSRGPHGQKCKTITEHFHNEKKIDEVELVENTLKGYMFAEKPIPMVQSESTSTNSGNRSFKCIGFAKVSDVRDEYLAGTGIWAVVGHKDSFVAEKMLAALTTVMRQSQLVMIVRYVYSARAKPKMMALFPNDLLKDKPDHNSMVMHELIYKDNLVEMLLPSLKIKKTEPTAEQYEAVDKLIDSMDLMSVDLSDEHGESTAPVEAFKNLLNPVLQHTYRRIAQRALHPKEPLIAPDKDLLAMLNVPKSVAAQAKPHVEQVKNLFKLEPIQRDTVARKQVLYNKMQAITTPNGTASASDAEDKQNDEFLVAIGTVTPDEDFDELLRRGERFAPLAIQMQNVIQELVFKPVEIIEDRVLRAIMMYRQQAIQLAPYSFNEWINEFKTSLLQRRKLDEWQKFIVAEGFGLITRDESENSTVTAEEATAFYRNDSTAMNPNMTEAMNDDENVDDLFDNM